MVAVRAFVVATIVVLAACAVGVLGLGASASATGAIAVDADVPDPSTFQQPTADGVAMLDGERYSSVQDALAAADPGDTVELRGRFEEHVQVRTPNVTLRATEPAGAVVDGGGEGDVLSVEAPGVTVEGLWVRNSGWSADDEDTGVFVNGTGTTVRDVRVTNVTFGVWINGVDEVTVANATIVGHPGVESHAQRGNGIHLWKTEDVQLRENDVTRMRDGIYFSWAMDVEAVDNRLWDLRYGVHYMYSNDNRLADNLAFDNDVGYALMVSERLVIANNTAIGNHGQSGHGIMVKEIEDTVIRDNVVADNERGLYVYNALDNEITGNLALENDVGIYHSAGSEDNVIRENSVIRNDVQAYSTRTSVIAWNGSAVGNYWSGASTVDVTGDGVSDTRHRPAGTVERVLHENPEAAVFTESPAFSVVRLAEDSFPALESPGIVDHRPAMAPFHDDWQAYYAEDESAVARSKTGADGGTGEELDHGPGGDHAMDHDNETGHHDAHDSRGAAPTLGGNP